MFSTISTFAFPDDTSMFLLILAILTFALNSISFVFVRLLPPAYSTLHMRGSLAQLDSQVLQRAKSYDGQRPNPAAEEGATKEPATQDSSHEPWSLEGHAGTAAEANASMDESSSLLSKSSSSNTEEHGFRRGLLRENHSGEVDFRGLALLAKTQFWQLFIMFGLFSGIGLMNIK